ncbi:hypothetical protein CkaCkLH20_03280 [Colletotrichum karsti]|uniref:Tripeptidyl aminopeptidase n=1 Tax=Colletotrichum karsti TaxID=1095194 RepID=A0A9P6LNY9_9PEZI|nr:uncharacterized protein CkaCkLH20_03280 [Colletotrichum karsti]KAF9879047.1 hypothetical protein CkaCkLH20_03280 [Colletotrichum karsti]
MKARTIATAAILLGAETTRAQNCTFETISPSKDLIWCPCEDQFLCARLDVPLDYKNPELARASVPLLKLPATPDSPDGPYRGAVLVNPGGPGVSGLDLVREGGALLRAWIGSNYDIVGFDPRGVGLGEPRLNCSTNTTTLQTRDEEPHRLVDDFYQRYIDFSADLGRRCEARAGGETGAGRYMTTAVTARDMLSFVDAFASSADGGRVVEGGGNASVLNYYGISYGTFLGQTFASMFPGRVGRVALDGVVSPEGYQANGTFPGVTHLDGVLGAFFVYCHAAGPEACAYYTGETAMDIFERWRASFARLDARGAEAEGWANASEIASALLTFKVGMLTAATGPVVSFPAMAEALVGLEAALAGGELAAWTAGLNAAIGDPGVEGRVNPEQSLGVLCSDQGNRLFGTTLEGLRPFVEQVEGQSVVGETWVQQILGCSGWSIRGREVFEGPYGGETRADLLFVSNTFDPTTPIENTVNNAPKFKGARRLTIEGLGHTASATLNQCALAVVKSYFQGTMCGRDIYCPLEAGPFNVLLNGSIQENLVAAGLADISSLYK